MRLLRMLSIVLAAVCLSACAAASEDVSVSASALRVVEIHLLEEHGYLIPFSKYIPFDASPEEGALACLCATEENASYYASLGLSAPLPAETAFSLAPSGDGTATLDFSNWAPCASQEAEAAAVQAVVKTLLAFESVDRVQFRFSGKGRKTLAHGTPVSGFLTELPDNAETVPVSADGTRHGMTLFFPNARGYLVPVTRYQAGKPTLADAIESLLDGPGTPNLVASFPEGTRLDSVQLTHGEAIVCFTGAFRELGRSGELEEAALRSLLLTASAFPEVRAVVIEVEGEAYAPVSGVSLSLPAKPAFFPSGG